MLIPWEIINPFLSWRYMIGIYKITKIKNGKSYIGQSNDIKRRFSEHKSKTDIPIEIAIQKYGEKAFSCEILEECSLRT